MTFIRLPWLKVVTGSQEVKASLFCGNSNSMSCATGNCSWASMNPTILFRKAGVDLSDG
jgi:hypothetical protein